MKLQRFNPESDLAPMPFEERICLKALDWHQARLIYRKLAETDAVMDQRQPGGRRVSSAEELLHIYGLIIDVLKEKDHLMTSQS
ncbi:MAG: hypothetical protein V2I56_19730 [Desulfobacteraceae bacterium]|jgi:hypothetical protein|nr:hypothetical protein [Desulfobacteraceae bacterium]